MSSKNNVIRSQKTDIYEIHDAKIVPILCLLFYYLFSGTIPDVGLVGYQRAARVFPTL